MREIDDAPGSIETPYILTPEESFKGFLERPEGRDYYGRDFVGIQLTAGELYSFTLSSKYAENGTTYGPGLIIRSADGTELLDRSNGIYAEPVMFKAPETGLYFLDPQYPSRFGLPGPSRRYTIETQSLGPAGNEEVVDAPAGLRNVVYSIGEGETFTGRLGEGEDAVDHDGLMLDFDQAGSYRITLRKTDGTDAAGVGLLLWDYFEDVYDHLRPSLFTDAGEVSMEVELFGPTSRYVEISNWDNVNQPWSELSAGGATYSVSIEYLAPIPEGTPTHVIDFPERPLDGPEVIETEDLSGSNTDLVLQSGETFYGQTQQGDVDQIGLQVVAGRYYAFWFTGAGATPLDRATFQSDITNLRRPLEGHDIGFFQFLATETGVVEVSLGGEAYYQPGQVADYSFTFSEDVTLDEAFGDAPGDATSTARLNAEGRFVGVLEDGDRDWVKVRLKEGHTYTLSSYNGFGYEDYLPVFLNKKGKALTYSAGDFDYLPEGASLFTAQRSGVFFVEATAGGGQYELVLEDHGVVGLSESIDKPWFGKTPYEISTGETFAGTSQDGSWDSVRLDLAEAGIYRVSLSNGDTDDSKLSVWGNDIHVDENGNRFALIYAHAGEKRNVGVYNEPSTAEHDYTLTLDLLSQPELDEVADLPRKIHDVVAPMLPGTTFTGHFDRNDRDSIPLSLTGGTIYSLELTGYGADLPFGGGELGSADFTLYNANGKAVDFEVTGRSNYLLLHPDETGTFFVEYRNADSMGLYEVSFNVYDGLFTGRRGADQFEGTGLDDTAFGLQGDDVLLGGKGQDVLDGGAGADNLLGENGSDVLKGGAGNDFLDGGRHKDTLNGDRGNDHLMGGDGADLLDGGRGNDTLEGGRGGDTLKGGAGHDILYATDFGGEGRNVLFGGRGNDHLFGGDKNDVLRGGTGDDILAGGQGWDLLVGGESADVFRFNASYFGSLDLVSDFNVDEDEIHLDSLLLRGRSFEDIMSQSMLVQAGQIVDLSALSNGTRDFSEAEFNEDGLLLKLNDNTFVFLRDIDSTAGIIDTFDIY